jgi:hypothetical protein
LEQNLQADFRETLLVLREEISYIELTVYMALKQQVQRKWLENQSTFILVL